MNSSNLQQLHDILQNTSPIGLEHNDILAVAAVCKDHGLSMDEFGSWLYKDPDKKRDPKRLATHWKSLRGSSHPVGMGTIVQLARSQGYEPPHTVRRDPGRELSWNDTIGPKDAVINHAWIQDEDVPKPGPDWKPHIDLINYLSVLFRADEYVGYVTGAWWNEKAEKWLPKKGNWDRTAEQLIEQLGKSKGDIGSVIGDCNPEVGAWIRFNPLDGQGIRDENVTDYRYALIESDTLPIDRQYALIKQLELPVAAMVHSGKKSIHAIVRIDADTYQEYQKRVDYLFEVCNKNGLEMDRQNRNPSRLSRMPGVLRNGEPQYLIGTNLGKADWKEWEDWIEDLKDDLPDPVQLTDIWGHMPELADPIIAGVLRKGHKMLLTGPSKGGKSYALIELCIAIAEGKDWLGWDCAQGQVLYVNLELDEASCFKRFHDVYQEMGLQPDNIHNISIWNLRGHAVPMDKLAPKLIRRAELQKFSAVIVDPIYKVITGDENSAEQMAKFCNQFDKICQRLGAATVFCHHHSKGSQGSKQSRDRASGSGVFARDPDALLDMIELSIDEDRKKVIQNRLVCSVMNDFMNRVMNNIVDNWQTQIPQDDMVVERQFFQGCERLINNHCPDVKHDFLNIVFEARQKAKQITGWRIEGTLREFPRFEPRNIFWDWPIHKLDDDQLLKDALPAGEDPPWMKSNKQRNKEKTERKRDRMEALETAYSACSTDGHVTITDMAEYMAMTEKSVRNRINEHPEYEVVKGLVFHKVKGEK